MNILHVDYHRTISKEKYIKEKLKILEEFCVPITQEIRDKLSELYPRETIIENYIRKLINKRLELSESYEEGI